MNSRYGACLAAGLSACLSLASCSPPTFHVPPPVPPPIQQHVVAAPPSQTWAASLRALAVLDLTPVESDPKRGSIVTGYHRHEGNSKELRNSGIARFAVERDIYSAGRERLLVNLMPTGADRTQVKVTAVVQAKVERRGEIRYAKASPETPRAPTRLGVDWETLTSNGVLEDEFLAVLATELSRAGAASSSE